MQEKEQLQSEIKGYKQLLQQTDYQAIKYAEGQISSADYEPIRLKRQELRDKINELETEIELMGEEL